MCLIELTGSYQHGRDIRLTDKLSQEYYYIKVDNSSVRQRWMPDDETSGNTTEAAFKDEMKQQIDEAQAKGDLKQVESLINSLNYGLDALHNNEIIPT